MWQVATRVLNRDDPGSSLAQATHLLLTPGLLETQATVPNICQTGQWVLMRDEILNRPYLSFELSEEATRALVMRLRRSVDGLRSQLNLYFASGLEMQFDRA